MIHPSYVGFRRVNLLSKRCTQMHYVIITCVTIGMVAVELCSDGNGMGIGNQLLQYTVEQQSVSSFSIQHAVHFENVVHVQNGPYVFCFSLHLFVQKKSIKSLS